MSNIPNPPKHPHHMTTDEAIAHLFHPDVPEELQRLKNQKDEPKKQPLRKS